MQCHSVYLCCPKHTLCRAIPWLNPVNVSERSHLFIIQNLHFAAVWHFGLRDFLGTFSCQNRRFNWIRVSVKLASNRILQLVVSNIKCFYPLWGFLLTAIIAINFHLLFLIPCLSQTRCLVAPATNPITSSNPGE